MSRSVLWALRGLSFPLLMVILPSVCQARRPPWGSIDGIELLWSGSVPGRRGLL